MRDKILKITNIYDARLNYSTLLNVTTKTEDVLKYVFEEIGAEHNIFLGGGAVECLLFPSGDRMVKDFDFFVVHGPETEDDDMKEIEDSIIFDFKTSLKKAKFKVSTDRVVNDGTRTVTLYSEKYNDMPSFQFVFSSTEHEDREEAIKERLSRFDQVNSMFAMTYRDGKKPEIYLTRLGVYTQRKKFAIMNIQEHISPRCSFVRLNRVAKRGWYTKYAIDQLVTYIENNKNLLLEIVDPLYDLKKDFHVSDSRLKVPKWLDPDTDGDADGVSRNKKKIEKTLDDNGVS